jgi:hypothetical protein
MRLVEEDVQTPYEAYREPENEEGSLTEEAVSIEAY